MAYKKTNHIIARSKPVKRNCHLSFPNRETGRLVTSTSTDYSCALERSKKQTASFKTDSPNTKAYKLTSEPSSCTETNCQIQEFCIVSYGQNLQHQTFSIFKKYSIKFVSWVPVEQQTLVNERW